MLAVYLIVGTGCRYRLCDEARGFTHDPNLWRTGGGKAGAALNHYFPYISHVAQTTLRRIRSPVGATAAMPSPRQPQAALTAAEIQDCVSKVGGQWSGSGAPIVVSYSTSVPDQWQLGVSAAAHEVPLVLAGLGRRGWHWYNGGGDKLPGTARALQLLDALAPEAPVVFADGGDTVVANRWTQDAALALLTSSSSNIILTGGECNSWPLCYNQSYLLDTQFRRCLGSHAACFPNSGTYLGKARTLQRFVTSLRTTVQRMDKRGYKGRFQAERGNDQAALHHLFLSQSTGAREQPIRLVTLPASMMVPGPAGTSGPNESLVLGTALEEELSLRVDGANAFFLSLFACGGRTYRRRGTGPYEYCYQRDFDVMPALRVRSPGLLTPGLNYNQDAAFPASAPLTKPKGRIEPGPARPGHPRSGDAASGPAHGANEIALHPFLLHSNGKHYRLSDRTLAPLMKPLVVRNHSISDGLASRPVLLIDSVALGTCAVSTLGSVLRGSFTTNLTQPRP